MEKSLLLEEIVGKWLVSGDPSLTEVAETLSPIYGVTRGHVRQLVDFWKGGRIYAGCGNPNLHRRRTNFERLSLFLFMIGVEEENALIHEVKSLDGSSSFQYPPSQSQDIYVERDRLSLLKGVSDRVSDLGMEDLVKVNDYLDNLKGDK